jgi:Tol biopolymer transport system component
MDTTDPPRMFAYNTATKALRWLAPRSWSDRSPVVDTEKVPRVFYVAGTTVRKISTKRTKSRKVFSAPKGWRITALTVAGTAAPYVALTRSTGDTPATATTYVVHLTAVPVTVMPRTPGSVTALALSPDTKTLAVSRTKPNGDSALSLQAEAHGGLWKALPTVGTTDQMSWSPTGDTLAVDPEQWGGWTLVTVLTGATSYPMAVQPYGGGIFAP